MKKINLILMLLAVVFLFGTAESKAQSIVRKIPPFRVQRRSPQPTPKHVWIPEEWDPFAHGSTGDYVPGFWEVPPRAGLVWIPGRWAKHPKGFQWIGGHWK